MKHIYTLLIAALLLPLATTAQLTFSSTETTVQIEPETETKAHIYVDNNSGGDLEVEWTLLYSSLNNDWSIQFCECTSCYTNEFSDIEDATDGGKNCGMIVDGASQQDWYLTVNPGTSNIDTASWVVVVNNKTDRVKDTLTYKVTGVLSTGDLVAKTEVNVKYMSGERLWLTVAAANGYVPAEVEIYNLSGQRVKSLSVDQFGSGVQRMIDVSDLYSGMYIVRILNNSNGEAIYSSRFVKN